MVPMDSLKKCHRLLIGHVLDDVTRPDDVMIFLQNASSAPILVGIGRYCITMFLYMVCEYGSQG